MFLERGQSWVKVRETMGRLTLAKMSPFTLQEDKKKAKPWGHKEKKWYSVLWEDQMKHAKAQDRLADQHAMELKKKPPVFFSHNVLSLGFLHYAS